MSFTVNVNGRAHTVDVERHAAAVGPARRARDDRHQIRLWHGAVRGLYSACRRHSHTILHHLDRQHRQFLDHDDRDRRLPRAQGSRKLGSMARFRNAATASRARSCPPRHCWRATRIRPMPTSTMPCPATSAVAGPILAFAKRSSRLRQAEGGSRMNTDHRPHLRRSFLQVGAATGGGLMQA